MAHEGNHNINETSSKKVVVEAGPLVIKQNLNFVTLEGDVSSGMSLAILDEEVMRYWTQPNFFCFAN